MENTGQVPAPFPNMNRLDDILVLTPQFSPIEARLTVLTSVRSPDSELLPAREKPALRVAGWVNGPLCEYAETLRQRTSLKQESPSTESKAFRSQALILEPCFWEPEHPFCYELAIELYEGSEIRDRRRMLIGIRHLQVRGRQLLFNGKPYFVQGTRRSSPASSEELRAWHAAECGAVLTNAGPGLCEATDRWGPMVLHELPANITDARNAVAQLRNHPSLLVWMLPSRSSAADLHGMVEAIRKLDASRSIGRILEPNEPLDSMGPVDLLLLPIGHPAIGSNSLGKPYIVTANTPAPPSSPAEFEARMTAIRDSHGSPPGLVGVIL